MQQVGRLHTHCAVPEVLVWWIACTVLWLYRLVVHAVVAFRTRLTFAKGKVWAAHHRLLLVPIIDTYLSPSCVRSAFSE